MMKRLEMLCSNSSMVDSNYRALLVIQDSGSFKFLYGR